MLKADAQLTRPRRPAVIAALVGLTLAAIAAGALTLNPCAYRTETGSGTVTADGTRTETVVSSCSSLIETQGAGVLIVFAVPVLLALAGAASAAAGYSAPQAVIGVLLMLSLLASGIFMYFAPAGLALVVSAALRKR